MHISTLQVQGSFKTKLKVHGIVGACKWLRMVTSLGKRYTAVPLQVQGSDKTTRQS